MVEMVCLHVISLMEALQECNSTIFVKVGKAYDFYKSFHTAKSKYGFVFECMIQRGGKEWIWFKHVELGLEGLVFYNVASMLCLLSLYHCNSMSDRGCA